MSKRIKPSKEQLYDAYVKKGYSLKKIARMRRISENTIREYLQEYDIPIRPRGAFRKAISREKLKDMYEKKQLPVLQIAALLDVSEPTVYNYIRKFNLVRRNVIANKPSPSELHELYVKDKLSLAAIGEIVGVSAPTVRKWLHEYNIPVRGR